MAYSPSESLLQILALLDNARTLAIRHQKRGFASDVVRASSALAEKMRFPIDPKILKVLASSIADKPNTALADMFDSVKQIISMADLEHYKQSDKKDGDLPKWSDWTGV